MLVSALWLLTDLIVFAFKLFRISVFLISSACACPILQQFTLDDGTKSSWYGGQGGSAWTEYAGGKPVVRALSHLLLCLLLRIRSLWLKCALAAAIALATGTSTNQRCLFWHAGVHCGQRSHVRRRDPVLLPGSPPLLVQQRCFELMCMMSEAF